MLYMRYSSFKWNSRAIQRKASHKSRIKEDSAASPTQTWQTGHGPATLKQISNTKVSNHLARHCKPDCNSELRLIPPNRSEVICHFRSQVKRDISSIWNVKHLKAASTTIKEWNLGVLLCESLSCAMIWQATEPAHQSNCLQFCRLSWRLRTPSAISHSRFLHSVCDTAHSPVRSNQMPVRHPMHGLKFCV